MGKRTSALLVIALIGILCGSSLADAKRSPSSRAVKAAKAEVELQYPASSYGGGVSLGCRRLNDRKFICTFWATYQKEVAVGRVRVTLYKYGAVARVFDTDCYKVGSSDKCIYLVR